ncbi:DMT family transporter [Motiliproteus sediminis]|uniref:DMT family transporter n=1 Tax=Motiliproteus sediminis TaxID=1468178 RepID=UPI001AEF6147|nr:DMT family transporter [Motiliproteus sediminis]
MPLFGLSHLMLFAVAAIWGFAFVAQSAGMDHLGPHSFNAARLALGALSLVPLWLLMGKRRQPGGRPLWLGGALAGSIMFGGFACQQMGLVDTTAGNAGFITGMYIVMVPLVGFVLGQRPRPHTWAGVALAVAGLYSLSIGPDFSINRGDLQVLIGALFWTAHVLVIGWLSPKVDAISLAIWQFVVASLWATAIALWLETPQLGDFGNAWLSLVYAGVASSGIAFTLQIIAQRKVEPSITALILSLEAVFAVIGGWLLLGESLGSRELTGCALMLAGMLISQWPAKTRQQALPAAG